PGDDAVVVVPRRVEAVRRNRVNAHVVTIRDRIPIERLGLRDVRAGGGAPRLADRADGARALAEERAVRLPIDLLVLEADERDRRVAALLERPTLPPVDHIGPIHARLAGRRDAEAAHH